MKAHNVQPIQLPLPAWVLHPFTALVIALMHAYLAAEHLLKLFGGEITGTNIWKGLGALGGAYVFAALASRGLTLRQSQRRHENWEGAAKLVAQK